MEIFLKAQSEDGLTKEEIKSAVLKSLEGKNLKKVLLIPPDFTRFHSNAGYLTNLYYHALKDIATVDIIPALGTHLKMTKEECEKMFGDIPFDRFFEHDWRNGVVDLGYVPGEYMAKVSDGVWKDDILCQINKQLYEGNYDLIISMGQVVPHEVVGMANHSKNLFVGLGGSAFINSSHMVGALYGLERIMGKDKTPPRLLFDYAFEHYLKDFPILFCLTVTTAPQGNIKTHGLFISESRKGFEEAVALAQQKNLIILDKPIKKCIVYLDPSEFKSTWLGNKSIYRTRMAIADNGELIVLAPGVKMFGEDKNNDEFIRKYGYCGRQKVLDEYQTNKDFDNNKGAAAHLIHGSSDGRFSITYCVQKEFVKEIESVHYLAKDYNEFAKLYDVNTLKPGYNMVNGEEVYFIPNPALGLWMSKDRL